MICCLDPVDHLNNALNNSTVTARGGEKATTELEADQQSVRRNSKFSIRAAENAASICMTNGTFVQGVRGPAGAAGGTRAGRAVTVHSAQQSG